MLRVCSFVVSFLHAPGTRGLRYMDCMCIHLAPYQAFIGSSFIVSIYLPIHVHVSLSTHRTHLLRKLAIVQWGTRLKIATGRGGSKFLFKGNEIAIMLTGGNNNLKMKDK